MLACGRVPMMAASTRRIVVISGPSGVGKGTLIAALMARVPGVRLAVSATTRPPRPLERDGREYYFWDDEQFDAAEADGRMLESARYGAHRYGTLIDELSIAPATWW
ncbi:MAG: guanylate kinase [Vicinamibacteria bacterium]